MRQTPAPAPPPARHGVTGPRLLPLLPPLSPPLAARLRMKAGLIGALPPLPPVLSLPAPPHLHLIRARRGPGLLLVAGAPAALRAPPHLPLGVRRQAVVRAAVQAAVQAAVRAVAITAQTAV